MCSLPRNTGFEGRKGDVARFWGEGASGCSSRRHHHGIGRHGDVRRDGKRGRGERIVAVGLGELYVYARRLHVRGQRLRGHRRTVRQPLSSGRSEPLPAASGGQKEQKNCFGTPRTPVKGGRPLQSRFSDECSKSLL